LLPDELFDRLDRYLDDLPGEASPGRPAMLDS
jgi:hypothetical protein